MKEILKQNESIGFAVNISGLDYEAREDSVKLCTDSFSALLTEKQVSSRIARRNEKCFSVRMLRGYSSNTMIFLREEVELNSGRSRFFIQKECVGFIKGLMVEDGIAVSAVGIDGLKQKSVDRFAEEALCDFANCSSFASFKE